MGVRINVLKKEETIQGRGSIPVSGGGHSTQVSEDKSSCHTNCFCQRRLHFILEPKKTFLTPSSPSLSHTLSYLKWRTMFQFCESDCHRGWNGLGTWTTMMGLHQGENTCHKFLLANYRVKWAHYTRVSGHNMDRCNVGII